MNKFCRQALLPGIKCQTSHLGFIQRFTTCITSNPSCSTRVCSKRPFSKEITGIDMVENRGKTKLKPSPEFVSSLGENSRQLLDKIVAEVEILEWMMPHPPAFLNDNQWRKLMKIKGTEDRVAYLRAYGKHVFRDQMLQAKRKAMFEARTIFLNFQRARFNMGAMGYGPLMYQLISPKLERNGRRARHIEGAAMWRSLRLNEKPRIVVDCQFIANEFDDFSSRLAVQLLQIIKDNFQRREPFDLSIVNYDENNPNCEVVTRTLKTEYAHQTVMPFYTDKDVVDLYNKEDLIYVAKVSPRVIQTPLNDKVYVICLGRENRLPLAAARKRGCRTARIPFNEHFKLYTFHFLPFTSVVRVLHEVYQTGGDWHTAILNGISRRYFIRDEDNISKTLNAQAKVKNADLTQQISQMVKDALQSDNENK